MRLQILHVSGCPNTEVLLTRLEQVVNRADVQLTEVHDQTEAVALGMAGSPTLLVDGVDPFASAAQQPSMSCRLYTDDNAAVCGAPSVRQLRAVLSELGRPERLRRERRGRP